MKRLLLLVPTVFALNLMSWSQVPSDSGNSQNQATPASIQNSATPTGLLPTGTVLSAVLSHRLDAKKYKANDKVEARIMTDLFVHGQVVVPQNTKIIGHVVEVKTNSKTSPGSIVRIALDRILLKGVMEIPLAMTIQAIAQPVYQLPVGREPDNLANRHTTPYGMPPVGATPPATGSASLIPDHVDNIPAPPSINTGGPSPSTSVSPLGSASRGVVGQQELSLSRTGPISVLSSNTGNLHLDRGTQLILRVQ